MILLSYAQDFQNMAVKLVPCREYVLLISHKNQQTWSHAELKFQVQPNNSCYFYRLYI